MKQNKRGMRHIEAIALPHQYGLMILTDSLESITIFERQKKLCQNSCTLQKTV